MTRVEMLDRLSSVKAMLNGLNENFSLLENAGAFIYGDQIVLAINVLDDQIRQIGQVRDALGKTKAERPEE